MQVPAGCTGRYWAPEYARMLAVYGPNPDAVDTQLMLRLSDLTGVQPAQVIEELLA